MDFYRRRGAAGLPVGDPTLGSEDLIIGADDGVRDLLAEVRRAKAGDWNTNYCVLCIRLGIEGRRAMLARHVPPDAMGSGTLTWGLEVYDDAYSCMGSIMFYISGPNFFMRLDNWLRLNPREQPGSLGSVRQRTFVGPYELGASRALESCLRGPRESEVSQSLQNRTVMQMLGCRCCIEGIADPYHLCCQDSATKLRTGIPHRLLQLCAEGTLVRLIRRDDELDGRQMQYIALSHCWGEPEGRLLLTKQTEALFSAGVVVSRLARTFRHAINITVSLGYRYIWIDSLCILQDCADDWQIQSASMGKVYANSSLSIAALEATDDDEGMLPNTDRRVVYGFKMNPSSNGTPPLAADEHSRVLVWGNSDLDCDCGGYDDPLRFNLSHRGWVYQERELAARTLLVDDLGMRWSCRSKKNSVWPRFYENSSGEAHLNWIDVIEAYSRTRLTYAKDRLIAIAAIAEGFGQRKRGRYHAGLFEAHFVSQLAWSIPLRWMQTLTEPMDQYVAPSWSWASINRSVTYGSSTASQAELAKLISADIELVDLNSPFGQVRSGQVTLLCELLPVSSLEANGNPSFHAAIEGWGFVHVRAQKVYVNCTPDTKQIYDQMTAVGGHIGLYTIPLLIRQNGPGFLILYFIIVEKLPDETFRRLGMCTHQIRYRAKKWYDLAGWDPRDYLSREFKGLYFPLAHDLKDRADFWRDLAVEMQSGLGVKGTLITIV